MKQQQLYKLSILVATAIITLGCVKDAPPARLETPEVRERVSEPVKTTLSMLQSSGVSNLSLKSANKEYKESESIAFTVNTMGKAGYLYIIYLDNKGDTQLLYPNPSSPLTELSGEYTFPRDFGNMNIRATKDCDGCSQDKTTIYAILTKEPVSDINSITKSHLLKFSGVESSKTASKSLSMDLGGSSATTETNVNIGKIEFIVK